MFLRKEEEERQRKARTVKGLRDLGGKKIVIAHCSRVANIYNQMTSPTLNNQHPTITDLPQRED